MDLDPYDETQGPINCKKCHNRHLPGDCDRGAKLGRKRKPSPEPKAPEPADGPGQDVGPAVVQHGVDGSVLEFYDELVQEIDRLTLLRAACETGKGRDFLEKIYKLEIHPESN